MVRLPVSIRLMVEGLRLARAASSSSESPSVVRRLRSRLRTDCSMSWCSGTATSRGVLRILQGLMQGPQGHRIVAP